MNSAFNEENLAMRDGVCITTSVLCPSGSGSRDPHVLLNETAHQLHDRPIADFSQGATYDTYNGQNQANGPDWYAIEFTAPTTFNCLEMTMGFPYRDGGWWTTLDIQIRANDDAWHSISGLAATPPYTFADTRGERRPFETHAFLFPDVSTCAVRIIGQPGGIAQFTSLARIAVYQRDVSRWNPLSLPEPPTPHILRLLPPHMVWDLSEHLAKLTDLTINFPLLEYYLDEQRYHQFWRRMRRIYEGEPDLWFLVGDAMGWDAWRTLTPMPLTTLAPTARQPYVRRMFHDTLACAVAPIVIEDQVLGELTTSDVVLKDKYDLDWHRRYADEHQLDWSAYSLAVERSHQMTLEQMEGAAGLLGMMANTIAGLAHHNSSLQQELAAADQRASQRKTLIRQAISFMQDHLETAIDVSDVAHAVAMSPSYFCTIFTQHIGRTPSDFLIDLRLTRAKDYLLHTDMSVTEVAIQLNYDPSYFSRLFKRRIGITPGAFGRRPRV